MVGQQITKSASSNSSVDARIDEMIVAAATPYPSEILGAGSRQCEVVATGVVAGERIGALLLADGSMQMDDDSLLAAESTFRALASVPGQELTYTCVPSGSGARVGIDRDEDGHYNRADNCPMVFNPQQTDVNGNDVGDVCEPGATTTTTTTTLPVVDIFPIKALQVGGLSRSPGGQKLKLKSENFDASIWSFNPVTDDLTLIVERSPPSERWVAVIPAGAAGWRVAPNGRRYKWKRPSGAPPSALRAVKLSLRDGYAKLRAVSQKINTAWAAGAAVLDVSLEAGSSYLAIFGVRVKTRALNLITTPGVTMKYFVTLTFAATVLAASAVSVSATEVQQDLDAKITSGTGIFSGLVGETVLVHVFYDTDLDERFPGTPIVDQFLSFDPPSNAGLTMGVEIEAGGIVRSTVAAGVADHDISIQDTAQLDQWSIDTVNVLSPISQVSITLRGNTSFVSPGDGGLTGIPTFPTDYCAARLAAVPLAVGNFTAYAGGQLEGSLTYDFLQGPTCSSPAALCGDANGDLSISATDALITLNASIGLGNCEICVCDVNGSGGVTASDASVVLAAAVGQLVVLDCEAC